jgi:RNA polymerase sigma factor (sigma-70 family)
MSLQQWVKEARKGSAAAQKCLFDAFSGSLLLVCRRYVKDDRDAEELMLNGFCRFFTTLPSFQYRTDAALYTWIKKIAINECLMFLRKKTGFVLTSEPCAEDHVVYDGILEQLGADEIFELIRELPPGYRTVFNLHVIEGCEHREIAEMLGISEGTSKSQLNKAKKLLQKNLLQKGLVYERKTK